MPRPGTDVKPKLGNTANLLTFSPGAVDLHFHGAFGIDLMRATPTELGTLSERLLERGIAAFCPTTLTSFPRELRASVERLGVWIRAQRFPGAVPLGIHLEGPFLARATGGVHPGSAIRPLSAEELEALWDASHRTLKILTLAPEALTAPATRRLASWCRARGIRLSLGHSAATQTQARKAFDLGFQGVTHAWNAMPFHHRRPGILGAALGRKGVSVEVIADGVHVSPTLLEWTRQLHPDGLCLVSDAAPAAGTRGGWHPFGPLMTRCSGGVCVLRNGELAGGATLLPEALAGWINHLSDQAGGLSSAETRRLLQARLPHITSWPLRALGLPSRVPGSPRLISWRTSSRGKILAVPARLRG